MLVFILIIIAILIIRFSFSLTSGKKKLRIIVGSILTIVSIFSYPLLVPVFGEWNGFDGVASLMVFNFILLLGGIITLIASLFMPRESMNNNEQL
ncbi:hypothetical protein [Bacillus sp. V59.32b]|uniref:hypothetical protein n=1 Tax=Bacillus sp. V59.32b TaxID=1758642 RepID=UPI000E3D436B|nr:hypothetical protein [Bacillus sp. V59.32b]RFU69617.1 hypothetical protein D0463_01945 [Bacillus sp. V59.32b]